MTRACTHVVYTFEYVFTHIFKHIRTVNIELPMKGKGVCCFSSKREQTYNVLKSLRGTRPSFSFTFSLILPILTNRTVYSIYDLRCIRHCCYLQDYFDLSVCLLVLLKVGFIRIILTDKKKGFHKNRF